MQPEISVIISTYNQPKLLNLCLESFAQQSYKNFEIVVADDGSKQDTKSVIEDYKPLVTQHVWHEDNGFRKTTILNKAICASKSDYLLFTDGDCIAKKDLVAIHNMKRREKCFLSGSYYKLDKQTSEKINKCDIIDLFNKKKLKELGHTPTYKSIKFLGSPLLRVILDKITTTKPTWNGHCSSGWKKDIEAVNGFDERMVYGGEDRELGERLVNCGIKPIQIRHHSCLLHLYHKQSYISDEGKIFNQKIRKEVKEKQLTWSNYGIK